jgi:DNA-directed RNA polymerase specialized sigma24 family protein
MSIATFDGPRHFPSTRWSLVGRAAQEGTAEQRKALADLLTRYMPALRAHLILRKGFDLHQAEDLMQGFLLNKVLEHSLISAARRDRGKFRSFLLTSLDRFVVSQIRHERRCKRYSANVVSFDEVPGLEPASQESLDAFDVAWARELLAEALKRMQQECTNRPEVWGVFEARLLAPMLYDVPPMRYEQLIERFNLESPVRATNLLVTAKRMFVRVLRAMIAEYEPDELKIDLEIEALQKALAFARA